MKIETFCKRTGWPLDEFLELRFSDVLPLLELYGLHLRVTPVPVRQVRRRFRPDLTDVRLAA